MADPPESESNWTSFPALPEEAEEPVGLAEKLLGFFAAAVAPAPQPTSSNGNTSKPNSAKAASVSAPSEQHNLSSAQDGASDEPG